MKKVFICTAAVSGLIILFFLFKSSPVDPAAYTPPAAPEMAGPLSPNSLLLGAELLARGRINGPEDTAVDSDGRIYAGTQDGRIVRLMPDGGIEVFADTGGRPLGMMFDKNGSLIVCDSYKGLLSVNARGEVKVLADTADDVPFRFTDGLDIASNGIIYFTDASSKFIKSEYLYDMLEARPYGRFMSYNPVSGELKVLLHGLYFANGVAISENEDFVLINETYRYRIIRCWLKGPLTGKSDVFIDNLPGFPDNISANRKGTFWLALFTVRNRLADAIHPFPFIKKQFAKLPRFLWPGPKPYGLVLSIDEQGRILKSLHEPSGRHLREITSAKEHEGWLYLGSLHNDRIGKYRLP